MLIGACILLALILIVTYHTMLAAFFVFLWLAFLHLQVIAWVIAHPRG
jgi:hypothetical protein